MDNPIVPDSGQTFAACLRNLRTSRVTSRTLRPKRRGLSPAERRTVLTKTNGRCHICGGEVGEHWQADHVLAHSSGGTHAIDNYLPAHRLCNGYRWDYSAEEFQWVLKIGVWARGHMENMTPLGKQLLGAFCAYEEHRESRRTSPNTRSHLEG